MFAQSPSWPAGQPDCVNETTRSHVENRMGLPAAPRHAPHPPTNARFVRVLLPLALVALSAAGCATADEVRYGRVVAVPGAYDATSQPVRRPLSLGEIVAALRAGRSSHELADDIDGNGLLAPATSADIDLLLQSGADAELIDAVREASTMSGQGMVSPPVPVAPPVAVSPPVIVAPPPLYPGYGWYPYAPYAPYTPYAPFSFGFWYQDVPRYRPPRYPGPERWRHGDDRGRNVRPPQQGWQSPRLSPAPPAPPAAGGSIRPGGSPRVSPGGSPRVSPGGPGGSNPGAVRDRRTID